MVRQPVSFQNKTNFNLHSLLRAIDKNCLISKLPVEAEASLREIFVSPSEILKTFEQYSFIITNTYKLMDACSISIDFDSDKNMQCYSATKKDDKALLLKLAQDGFLKRYGKKTLVSGILYSTFAFRIINILEALFKHPSVFLSFFFAADV